MVNLFPNMDWLLDYEIRLSARYRRFLSFVRIVADRDSNILSRVLSETIRSSDVCFPDKEGISIIMGETAGADAIQAIQRFKIALNGSMNAHFALASFPEDGKTSSELQATAQKRIGRAKQIGSGTVVYEG